MIGAGHPAVHEHFIHNRSLGCSPDSGRIRPTRAGPPSLRLSIRSTSDKLLCQPLALVNQPSIDLNFRHG